MTDLKLQNVLKRLLAEWENECVEFKDANDNFSTSDIGKYFSALSNEANLHGTTSGWLVFGVDDKTRKVIGTGYRKDPDRLQHLKQEIAQNIDPKMSFREIHEMITPSGRVILFEIPSAPRGIPIAWNGHYYDSTGPDHVIMRLQGRFLDENYSRTLLTHADLPWPELLALDTIQKELEIDEDIAASLRQQGLVEGRRPHLHVASHIAASTETEAEYLHHRAFDDAYYCDLIIEYLKKFGSAKRAKFNRLLEDKLSDLLSPTQRRSKINNLLARLQREAKIKVDGYGKAGVWRLVGE
jgi:hypothetical protein